MVSGEGERWRRRWWWCLTMLVTSVSTAGQNEGRVCVRFFSLSCRRKSRLVGAWTEHKADSESRSKEKRFLPVSSLFFPRCRGQYSVNTRNENCHVLDLWCLPCTQTSRYVVDSTSGSRRLDCCTHSKVVCLHGQRSTYT